MIMVMHEITASRFKATCLAVLDDVSESGTEVIVTKHGRPVARVVPVDEAVSLRGSIEFLVPDDELIDPIDESWDSAG
jgi:prevent-host-death family protein